MLSSATRRSKERGKEGAKTKKTTATTVYPVHLSQTTGKHQKEKNWEIENIRGKRKELKMGETGKGQKAVARGGIS